MAGKRSAQPPPAASSEETVSGSTSEESGSEEIAQSPPTAAPEHKAAPPQKVQQPEASNEEESGEEEEEDDESGEEEEEGEEQAEGEDEEEEEVGEEEDVVEEKDGQEVEGSKLAPSSSGKKRSEKFQRSWSKDDEVRILEAVAAHHREHGTQPNLEDLAAAVAGKLDHHGYDLKDLMAKLRSIKGMYSKTVNKGDPPTAGTDRRIFDLSNEIWGTSNKPANDTASPPSGFVPSDFGELCAMYPFLAEELKKFEKAQPGLLKKKFPRMTNAKAAEFDEKVKMQRLSQMDVDMQGQQLTSEVVMVLRGLV